MPQLSPQFDPKRFSDKLADPDVGGYTVDPYSGYEPSSGTMMARYGAEVQVAGPASPSQVEAHAKTVSPGQYAGGWFDEGISYLDESRNFDKPQDAMKFGQANAQRAGFNLDTFKDFPVRYSSPPTRKDTLLGELPKDEVRAMDRDDQEIQRSRQESHLLQQRQVRETPSMQAEYRKQGAAKRAEKARVKQQLHL